MGKLYDREHERAEIERVDKAFVDSPEQPLYVPPYVPPNGWYSNPRGMGFVRDQPDGRREWRMFKP